MPNSELLQAFFNRVTPIVPELFNMAYAICGNYDLAEYVLQCTLMDAWTSNPKGSVGFREGMRSTLRRVAMDEALEPRKAPAEFTWDELAVQSDDPILSLLADESLETRRAVALRDGCGLPVEKIARLMGLPASRVRELLNRFERMAAKRMPAKERRRVDAHLARRVARQFARTDGGMPAMGVIYRSFMAEAMESRQSGNLAGRIVNGAVTAALVLLCALIFWLMAVLIQPAPTQTPAAIVTEAEQ